MKVLVQWTRANPRGWEEVDSTQWRALAKRPDPTGLGPGGLDDEPGWVFGLNVQGVYFTADHYAVEPLPERACRVTAWNDDPEYYPAGSMRYAHVWTFRTLRKDPWTRGALYNTAQTTLVYCEPDILAKWRNARVDETKLRAWDEFVPPEEVIVRHGKLVSEELNARHDAAREARGWHEWTEGVPRHLVDPRGHLRPGAR